MPSWLNGTQPSGLPLPCAEAKLGERFGAPQPALGEDAGQVVALVLTPYPNHKIIGIIGPAKSLKSNLAELGAPIEQIEWRGGGGDE